MKWPWVSRKRYESLQFELKAVKKQWAKLVLVNTLQAKELAAIKDKR